MQAKRIFTKEEFLKHAVGIARESSLVYDERQIDNDFKIYRVASRLIDARLIAEIKPEGECQKLVFKSGF